jgi:hypothetical protein
LCFVFALQQNRTANWQGLPVQFALRHSQASAPAVSASHRSVRAREGGMVSALRRAKGFRARRNNFVEWNCGF